MNVYLGLAKISFKNSILYKTDTLMKILGSIIALIIQIYIWIALLDNSSKVYEISIEQIKVYQITGIILGILYNNSISIKLGKKIKEGSISLDIIKPYNFALSMFSDSLGKVFGNFILSGVPVLLFAIFTTKPNINTTYIEWLLLMPIIFFNIIIYWLLYYIIGLLHFFLDEAIWFSRILTDSIKTLGGKVIPMWFFPEVLQNISSWMPFKFLYQFPQGLLINKFSSVQICENIGMQIMWILLLTLISMCFWKCGIKRLAIQGG